MASYSSLTMLIIVARCCCFVGAFVPMYQPSHTPVYQTVIGNEVPPFANSNFSSRSLLFTTTSSPSVHRQFLLDSSHSQPMVSGLRSTTVDISSNGGRSVSSSSRVTPLAASDQVQQSFSPRSGAYYFNEHLPQHHEPDYFDGYSNEQLQQLQAECHQYHYHYGPLYDVGRALHGISNVMQKSVYHTARQLVTSANHYGYLMGSSLDSFGRYVGTSGGKILALVMLTGLTLLGVSVLQVYFTVLGAQNGRRWRLFDVVASMATSVQQTLSGSSQESRESRRVEERQNGYDAINVLYMLEEAFQKLELSDFECQQRVICEAHESGAEQRYGSLASKLQNIIGSADLQTLDNTDSDASHVFKLFRNAAINGIQRGDCAATYAGRCTNGLRELARKSYKL